MYLELPLLNIRTLYMHSLLELWSSKICYMRLLCQFNMFTRGRRKLPSRLPAQIGFQFVILQRQLSSTLCDKETHLRLQKSLCGTLLGELTKDVILGGKTQSLQTLPVFLRCYLRLVYYLRDSCYRINDLLVSSDYFEDEVGRPLELLPLVRLVADLRGVENKSGKDILLRFSAGFSFIKNVFKTITDLFREDERLWRQPLW